MGKKALPKKLAYITGQLNEERDSCNAFVVMEKLNGVQKAVESLNGYLFEERHLRVDFASREDSGINTKRSVFVGNLPHNLSDEALWTFFSGCGTIEYVRIIRDKETGVGKGFGYVAFKDKASRELAMQLDGGDCGGRPIRVSKCAKPGYQQMKKDRLEKRTIAKRALSDQGGRSLDNKPNGNVPPTKRSEPLVLAQIQTKNQPHKDKNLEGKRQIPDKTKITNVKAKVSKPAILIEKHPAEIRKERKLMKQRRPFSKTNSKSPQTSNLRKSNTIRKDRTDNNK